MALIITLSHHIWLVWYQISGDALVVREALFQISCLLRENPSRFHDQICSKASHNPFGCHLIRDPTTRPCSPVEDSNEFILRLLCPSVNIRDVIGKGGANINQIRQESGATINLDCFFDEEDCIILISAKEACFCSIPVVPLYSLQSNSLFILYSLNVQFMGISNSPTINAATQLQPSCSTKLESEGDKSSYITRLLVHRSQVGSLIGKGGLIIKEMRRTTQTTISIVEDSLPSVASVNDAMVKVMLNACIVLLRLLEVL